MNDKLVNSNGWRLVDGRIGQIDRFDNGGKEEGSRRSQRGAVLGVAAVRADHIRPADGFPGAPGAIGQGRVAGAGLERGGGIGRRRSKPGEQEPIGRKTCVKNARGEDAGGGVRRNPYPIHPQRIAVVFVVNYANSHAAYARRGIPGRRTDLNAIYIKREDIAHAVNAVAVRRADQGPNRNIRTATEGDVHLIGASNRPKSGPVFVPGGVAHEPRQLIVIRAKGGGKFERVTRPKERVRVHGGIIEGQSPGSNDRGMTGPGIGRPPGGQARAGKFLAQRGAEQEFTVVRCAHVAGGQRASLEVNYGGVGERVVRCGKRERQIRRRGFSGAVAKRISGGDAIIIGGVGGQAGEGDGVRQSQRGILRAAGKRQRVRAVIYARIGKFIGIPSNGDSAISVDGGLNVGDDRRGGIGRVESLVIAAGDIEEGIFHAFDDLGTIGNLHAIAGDSR